MADTDDRRALFVKTEGEVGGYVGCGDPSTCHAIGERFLETGVGASYEMDPCCKAHRGAGLLCHRGDRDEDLDRRGIILALALARAEDRTNVVTTLAQALMDSEYRPPCVMAELLEFLAELP